MKVAMIRVHCSERCEGGVDLTVRNNGGTGCSLRYLEAFLKCERGKVRKAGGMTLLNTLRARETSGPFTYTSADPCMVISVC